MTATAGNIPTYGPIQAARTEARILTARFEITTAGAVLTTPTLAWAKTDDPGITLTYASSTGVYNGTLPIAKYGVLKWSIMSASLTVDAAVLTAFDPTAGTFVLKTVKGGTLTDPASGNTIAIEYTVFTGSDA